MPDPPIYFDQEGEGYSTASGEPRKSLPAIFTDPGWTLLSTSILSTSNCGNPALRLFGFGPVAADGYGIGYIIKDDGISMYVSVLRIWVFVRLHMFIRSVASSKHLQTRRFLDTLERYLLDVQKLIVQLHREANERSAPFVDHMGILRDARTGRPIHGVTSDEIESDTESFDEAVMSKWYWISDVECMSADGRCDFTAGYSFFDSGDIARLGREQARAASFGHFVGTWLLIICEVLVLMFDSNRQNYSYGGVLIGIGGCDWFLTSFIFSG